MAIQEKQFLFGKDLRFAPLSCVGGNNLRRDWFNEVFDNYDYNWFPETLNNERYELVEPFNALLTVISTNKIDFVSSLFELLTSSISQNSLVNNITGKYFTLEHTGTMDIDTMSNVCSSARVTTQFYIYE
jgi:hypothetical protein